MSGDDFGLRSFSRLSIPPEGGGMNTLEQVIMTRQQQQHQKQNKIKQKREKSNESLTRSNSDVETFQSLIE